MLSLRLWVGKVLRRGLGLLWFDEVVGVRYRRRLLLFLHLMLPLPANAGGVGCGGGGASPPFSPTGGFNSPKEGCSRSFDQTPSKVYLRVVGLARLARQSSRPSKH